MHALLHSVSPALQQATTDPRLCWRVLDTHRQVWVSLLWSHCSFFLGPGAYNVLFVPSKSLCPQSCVSSGSSVVRLMVTSSKRAYAIPRSTAPRAPESSAVHCWLVPLQETLIVLSQSLWGLWVLGHTRYVWALWTSLPGMGFDSKCDRVAYPFSRGSSWPKNQTQVPCIAGGFFTNWAIREAPLCFSLPSESGSDLSYQWTIPMALCFILPSTTVFPNSHHPAQSSFFVHWSLLIWKTFPLYLTLSFTSSSESSSSKKASWFNQNLVRLLAYLSNINLAAFYRINTQKFLLPVH